MLAVALAVLAPCGAARAMDPPDLPEADDPPAEDASDDASSPWYAWVGVATTALYVPNSGPVEGPLGDVSPGVAIGYYVSGSVSLELSVGVTVLVDGGYAATGVGPSIVWAVNDNVYLAGRVYVPVHPDVNLAVIPSIGVCQAFGHVAPYLELGVGSTVGRGQPDLAVAPSAGVTFLF